MFGKDSAPYGGEGGVWCGAPAVQYGLGSEGFYNGGRDFVLGLSKGILD